ncbi:hypothetical protein [Legionella tunisiensis]|uniref:hypothetical protein n=1 Tax=Legionella tunisiensis TaxID=1034944 RepID=UPI00037594DE|nr:hypothetical protein [Legionella tunisiensis]
MSQSNKRDLVTRHSIEASINFMVNKLNLKDLAKKFMKDTSIHSEEKLEIFQKIFSRKLLALLPNILVGKKGNLRHGFIDKSIQAATLRILTLLVMLDNVSNGWENNTQKEVEDRAESSFNYILTAIIIMWIIAAVVKLAETIIENREEDLKDLKTKFSAAKEKKSNIRAITESTESALSEMETQKTIIFTQHIFTQHP